MAGARHSPALPGNLGSVGREGCSAPRPARRPPAPRGCCREQTAPGRGGRNAGASRRGEKGALRTARPRGQRAEGMPGPGRAGTHRAAACSPSFAELGGGRGGGRCKRGPSAAWASPWTRRRCRSLLPASARPERQACPPGVPLCRAALSRRSPAGPGSAEMNGPATPAPHSRAPHKGGVQETQLCLRTPGPAGSARCHPPWPANPRARPGPGGGGGGCGPQWPPPLRLPPPQPWERGPLERPQLCCLGLVRGHGGRVPRPGSAEGARPCSPRLRERGSALRALGT